MGKPLSIYATGRDNNFNLIRFIAASLVLFSHSFALAIGSGDAEPLRDTLGLTWGVMAVDVFFITSGFLITGSYFSRNSLVAFVWARVLRIYPALIVAIVFCVFVVGTWFTTLGTHEYLLNEQTQKFLVKNSTLILGLEAGLPGVFLGVPYEGAVNGSLWTLPYEVKMYAIVAFMLGAAAYIGKKAKFITYRNVFLLIGVSSISLHILNHFHAIHSGEFLRLFSMFFVGAAFFIWKDSIRLSSGLAFVGLALLLLSSVNKDLFFVAYYLFLPYLIFYIAYVPAGQIRKFNSCGDYSYGIYIYAFPVQQSLAQLVPNITVPSMVVASFLVTLIIAMLSWHLVEKRFLRLKRAYTVIEDFIQSAGFVKRSEQTK